MAAMVPPAPAPPAAPPQPPAAPGGGGGGGAPGPLGSRNTAMTVAVVVVVGIILIMISLISPNKPSQSAMPDIQNKGIGLQFAMSRLSHENWHAYAYDANGENRGIRDQRDWKVCTQDVKADARPKRRVVNLGAVQTGETCPLQPYGQPDYGTLPQVYSSATKAGNNRVPHLIGYTPFMTREAFGGDASIQVVKLPLKETTTTREEIILKLEKLLNWNDTKVEEKAETVSGTPGDWVICHQSLDPDTVWNGRVLTLWVIPADDVPDRNTSLTVCGQLMAGQSTTPAPTVKT